MIPAERSEGSQVFGKAGFFAEFILSRKGEILRCAQNDLRRA